MSDTRQEALRDAYALLLGRAADSTADAGDDAAIAAGVLGSGEFRQLRGALLAGKTPPRSDADWDRVLAALGNDERFVRAAYRHVLGREADQAGLDNYLRELTRGLTRSGLVRALLVSEEFQRRTDSVAPEPRFIPRDVQLCELANPAKWDNPDWLDLLRSLGDTPDDKPRMHRKGYEKTQIIFGLSRLGFVREDVSVISVGAGHESPLYWLANRVGRVVATDLYEGFGEASTSHEGDSRVLEVPSTYAPFPYREDRLTFMRMDGRKLDVPDGTFDVAYSLSSIEHFGGVEGAHQAIDEMARVLRPGGIMAVATEYILSGAPYHEGFFPHQIHEIFSRPSLELVEPIDEGVYQRYDYRPAYIRVNRFHTPHMVIEDSGSFFTSVMVFLRKK